MLTSETLKGVWALVTTPWDEKDRLDEEVLQHDVAYQCQSGVHGLYTTGSSGEFFAMADDEFERFVDVFMEQVLAAGMPHQVGCGAADTRGTLRRVEYALERGAQALQIILPYYMEMNREEAVRFFEEVARAAGDTPLVHYNSPHGKNVLDVEDYLLLKERVPTVIGTKLPAKGPIWFGTVCEKVPEISHFTGEYTFVADYAVGAKGLCSWLAVTNPRLAVAWYEALTAGDLSRAMRIQALVNRYKICVKSTWHGQSDAAVNKADAALNPNTRCPLRVRSPYSACTRDDVDQARAWAMDHFPELLEL